MFMRTVAAVVRTRHPRHFGRAWVERLHEAPAQTGRADQQEQREEAEASETGHHGAQTTAPD
jgi:hypothetical protein